MCVCVEYLSFEDPPRMQSLTWEMHSACYTFQYIISGTCTFYFNAAREAIDPPEVDPKKERIIRINEMFSENTKGKMKLFAF